MMMSKKVNIRFKLTRRNRGRGSAGGKSPAVTQPSYRRNRTLTGSKPEVGTDRTRAHQLRSLRRKVGLVLMILLAAICVVAFGISQFSGSLKITLNDSQLLSRAVDTDLYQNLFDDYFEQYPLERFRFLTNHSQMISHMQTEAPEIVSIAPDGASGIGESRYQLKLRQPVASWTSNDIKYYVDSSGATFTRNYFQEPTVAVLDNSGAVVTEGAAIASGRLLSFVGRAVSLSGELGIDVSSIEIPPQSTRTLYIKVESLKSTVRMTIDGAVEAQVSDMRAAIEYFGTRRQPEYIDVRVQGKSYYK